MRPVKSAQALIVDDDHDVCDLLKRLFEREGISVATAHNGTAALELVDEVDPDVLLLDVKMPDTDGMEVLRRIRRTHPQLAVVMMTAFAGVTEAVEAMKIGAVDYLPKPFDNRKVVPLVRMAVARQAWHQGSGQGDGCRDTGLAQALAKTMGPSAAVTTLATELETVVDTDFSVVIQGETGTGKELVARSLHRHSQRARGPFVAVDCGAIAENLLENELFGHERGAFTGADRREIGKFEAAAGGTLFLDEIGNMPLKAQAALLRALQERVITRVGGTVPVPVDVRVVAASNEHFEARVAHGDFREDLWYRLNEFHVHLPPLRERRDDILYLVELFRRQLAQELGRSLPPFSAAAQARLLAFDWPGNVRELRSVVRRTCLLETPEIEADDLRLRQRPRHVVGDGRQEAQELPLGELSLSQIVNDNIARVERTMLIKALRHAHGNKAEAARLLKVDYKTIYNKLKRLNISQEEIGGGR
ncbi:sigma-54 dependent transcriptional regulator [uncultured Thiohalocapsa sp.]|uniref:sigma-54-dependent transcriptional regulator n=1 Tax=uncultured Thiohalocapsa sp. TaxID=768990 RepID=UPI0025DAE7CB|nr:sigma-54 dependent transcriptional regulator [uncultured Thiohalocapsa sp.]